MWPFIAGLVLAIGAMYVLKPKQQKIPPAGFNDLDVPTASDGREIPVLFGTKNIKSANVVWYGDFRSDAIKSSGGGKK